LQEKNFLEAKAVAEIEDVLKERETTADDIGLASPANGDDDINMAPSQTIPRAAKTSQQRLDKRQVEQRIEEDRERHKRQRESIWQTPVGAEAEREKAWDEASDLGEDDLQLATEENEELERCWAHSCSHTHTEAGKEEPAPDRGPRVNGHSSKSRGSRSSTTQRANHS
jgi:CTD kinase subunit gamma